MFQVITSLGPAKPQRSLNNNNNFGISQPVDLDHCQLLAGSNSSSSSPPHKLCLETSFTSLQPRVLDNSSVDSRHLPWEFTSLVQSGLVRQPRSSLDLIHDDWFGLAPLATPESLSEVSSISSRASTLSHRHPATSTIMTATTSDKKKHASVTFVDVPVKHHFEREDSRRINPPTRSWKSNLKQSFFSAENFVCVKSKTQSDSSPENCSLNDEKNDKFYSAESVSSDVAGCNNKEVDHVDDENSSESSPLLSSLHLLTDEKFQNLFKGHLNSGNDDSISSGSFKSVSSDVRDLSISMDSVTINAEVHRTDDKNSWTEDSNLLDDIEKSLNLRSIDSPYELEATTSPVSSPVRKESPNDNSDQLNVKTDSGGGRNKYIYPILLVGKGESSV